jgi:alpha-tubulin suppressor-like RCC1 family protein
MVGGLDSATAVEAGNAHACALRMDGSVWCWGANDLGQLGAATLPMTERSSAAPSGITMGATQIAIGGKHSCALLDDMTVRCWGSNSSGQLGGGSAVMPSSISPVQVVNIGDGLQITAGENWACALRSTASVWCWGDDTLGFLGDGNNTSRPAPVMAISCG